MPENILDTNDRVRVEVCPEAGTLTMTYMDHSARVVAYLTQPEIARIVEMLNRNRYAFPED